jgi:putative ABC transport system ATP-binding protein
MGNVIELADVAKRYEDVDAPALGPVNLTVAEGEALAIIGPSGSGKSTLLNLVSGLDKPSSGTVSVGGGRIDDLGETALARFRRDRIGMVFQFFNLLDDLTVWDNVLLPAQLAGAPRRTSAQRAQELLEALGIARHARAYPGRLSGGERQRVAVARALINKPALLLADEPTGALDTASGLEVRELLLDLHRSGQSIVLVTHDLALAQSCASRIVRLVDGMVAEDRANTPRSRQSAHMNRTAMEVSR